MCKFFTLRGFHSVPVQISHTKIQPNIFEFFRRKEDRYPRAKNAKDGKVEFVKKKRLRARPLRTWRAWRDKFSWFGPTYPGLKSIKSFALTQFTAKNLIGFSSASILHLVI